MTFDKALNFLFPNKCRICFKKGNYEICENCIKRIRHYEDINITYFNNRNLDSLIYFFRYEGISALLMIYSEGFNEFILFNKTG